MYRIKQNSANYRTFSLSIKAGNHRLYNYCSNNPLRYIDPDGYTPYSVKLYENHYEFEHIVAARAIAIDSCGFIPYVGSLLGNIVDVSTNAILEFRPIIIDDVQTADTLSLLTDIFSNFLGPAAKPVESRILSRISFACTLNNIYSEYEKKHLSHLEYFISVTFKDELCAKTHEGVTELYKYVLAQVINLEKSGRLSIIEPGSCLDTLGRTYYQEDIEELKMELEFLRKIMNQDPS